MGQGIQGLARPITECAGPGVGVLLAHTSMSAGSWPNVCGVCGHLMSTHYRGRCLYVFARGRQCPCDLEQTLFQALAVSPPSHRVQR